MNFKVENINTPIEVFTTRPDTIYGATFLVLSPEHTIVNRITTPQQYEKVKHYQDEAAKNLT